jgi:hypothetical protein
VYAWLFGGKISLMPIVGGIPPATIAVAIRACAIASSIASVATSLVILAAVLVVSS